MKRSHGFSGRIDNEMVKCGIVQASSVSDIRGNIEKVRRYVEAAKEKGCEVLGFPEAFLTSWPRLEPSCV